MIEVILVILGMLATFTIGYFIGGADATDHTIRYLEEIGLFSRLEAEADGKIVLWKEDNPYPEKHYYTGEDAK